MASSGTPASLVTDSRRTGTAPRRYSVACAIDNRAGEVGLATCCLTTMRVQLTQFADTPSYSRCVNRLCAVRPREMLLPSTAAGGRLALALLEADIGEGEGRAVTRTPEASGRRSWREGTAGSLVAETLASDHGQCTFALLHRRCFNETHGAGRLQELLAVDDTLAAAEALQALQDTDRYLAVAAGHALVQYLEQLQSCRLVPGTVRIDFVNLAQYVTIDRAACRALGLLAPPARHAQGHPTTLPECAPLTAAAAPPRALVDAVGRTATPMGDRLLRTTIRQPLSDAPTLALRHHAVLWLATDPSERHRPLQAALAALRGLDVDACLATFTHDPVHRSEASARAAASALTSLQRALVGGAGVLRALAASLPEPRCPQTELLRRLQETLAAAQLPALADALAEFVDDAVVAAGRQTTAVAQVQQCFVVRPGVDPALDAARDRYCHAVEALFAAAEELRAAHGLPSLALCHDQGRGYHLQADAAAALDPAVFTHVARRGRRVQCTTLPLRALCRAHDRALGDVLVDQDAGMGPMVALVRHAMGRLHTATESIALLDVLLSHSAFAQQCPEVCVPALGPGGPLSVVAGRCPTLPLHGAVPLTFALGGGGPSCAVLSGPNASGKTTLLREVAQWAVLAHIGCVVPARRCELPLLDGIWARLSADDEPTVAGSTFVRDATETARLTHSATRRSLVVLDELGRGTGTREAAALCRAVLEWLADLRVPTLCATHTLPADALGLAVAQWHLGSDGDRPRYEVLEGPPPAADGYGLQTAARVAFPAAVMHRASAFAALLACPSPSVAVRVRGVVAAAGTTEGMDADDAASLIDVLG